MYGEPELNTLTCVGALIGLAISIFLIWYTYTKAEEYGMNGCLWAILVFLFGLIAFAIFLILTLSSGRRTARDSGTSWGSYTPRPGVYGGQSPATGQQPPGRSAPPDPDFRDEHLDELIEDGRLSEARKYMREMIDMARSMGDQTGVRNYAQYEPRINKAAMDGTRRKRED